MKAYLQSIFLPEFLERVSLVSLIALLHPSYEAHLDHDHPSSSWKRPWPPLQPPMPQPFPSTRTRIQNAQGPKDWALKKMSVRRLKPSIRSIRAARNTKERRSRCWSQHALRRHHPKTSMVVGNEAKPLMLQSPPTYGQPLKSDNLTKVGASASYRLWGNPL